VAAGTASRCACRRRILELAPQPQQVAQRVGLHHAECRAFIAQIMKAMAITVAPSAVCRRSVATDSPITAPASEAIEPASASA